MRRFLYITPYFPPMSRVGALRPLKLARHLPEFGWAPVVLCDLRRNDAVNAELLEQVPDSTTTIWDYGRRAAVNKQRFDRGELGSSAQRSPEAATNSPRRRVRVPPVLVPGPEFIPLNEHSLDMPHATAAARRVLDQHPCDAVVVNADPYAALLVGARVARERGLPLVLDLRDPWAPCSLRRPKRRWLQRYIVDRLERSAVEAAAAVVLNTNTARDDYVAHYPDLPASRFHAIHNSGDAALIEHGSHAGFDRFTALFLGNFRRFVEGDVLLEALAELRRRGVGEQELQLVVSGEVPASTFERARELGVQDMLRTHPFVPYLEIGPFMRAADLLVSLSNDTEQRFPAKIFDYATTERPILVIADTRELVELARGMPGTRTCSRTDAHAVADAMLAELRAGRQRSISREHAGLDSASAAHTLASILDDAIAQPQPSLRESR